MGSIPSAPPRRQLAPHHLAELRASGLDDATIAASGIYTCTDRKTIQNILNWRCPPPATLGSGMVIPFFAIDGLICIRRVKFSNPRLDKKGKKIKYESPLGKPNCPYLVPGYEEKYLDASIPVVITEGEKKCLKATQEGHLTIGLVGIWGWCVPGQKDPKILITELASFPWDGREVHIAYDSDAIRNRKVIDAENQLADVLHARGAIVRIVRLPDGPPTSDGQPTKVGLDDYLLTHTAADLQRLIDATEPMPPAGRKRPIAETVAEAVEGLHRPPDDPADLAEREESERRLAAERQQATEKAKETAEFYRVLKTLIRKRGCGRVSAFAREGCDDVDEAKNKMPRPPIVIAIETRCHTWECSFCAFVNKWAWKLVTRQRFLECSNIWTAAILSTQWESLRRSIGRAKANFRRVEICGGMTKVYVDQPLPDFIRLTPEQAADAFARDSEIIAPREKKPISGSRPWKLPDHKGSGEFEFLTNCPGGFTITKAHDMLATIAGNAKDFVTRDQLPAVSSDITGIHRDFVALSLGSGEIIEPEVAQAVENAFPAITW